MPPDFQGLTRREREGGSYLRYHPDPMPTARTVDRPDVAELVADASASVAALGQRLRDRPVRLLYATLLRSESLASSWIEGLRETPRNVMAARLTDVHGTPSTAQDVLRNVDAMESAIASLDKPSWDDDDIHAVHATLLPRESRGRYRTDQVYVGGRTPLTASYVAPPADEVPDLMADLLRYVATTGDPPLVAALLVHAQFETIHPFEDGNGRTGRALFHAVVARAGIVDRGVLPLSLVLRDDVDAYIAALTTYRPGADHGRAVSDARQSYLHVMLEVVLEAARIAGDVIDEVAAVQARWRPYVERLRVDSSVHRLLDLLAEQPVVTPGLVQQCLGVSRVTANNALTELARVGVVQPAGGRFKRQNVYQAGDVLTLMDAYVPGPATVTVPPPPLVPVRRYGGERCGHLLPRKGVPCTLPTGHPGPHRAP
ncbi:Fic family protein [Cellulomonas sp. Sa3CUA2]|uniref:Fic family protein n=1 Tax=Cellulomonas avistercoris TaxID=2762242 RepID=A0ABR8QF82_9CELL|nr:Fic family protein [Cellulomonas avistercoris]MBD7919065.1 Fic family protein [Cellulomonas avistercoris]